MKLELVATAAFGLEAVVRREIEALGYKVLKTEDGRVTYMGDERAVVRSNLWLRSADRVYIRMSEFTATEFEELFQQVKAIEWEGIIPLEGAFPVVGGSVKSALHSVPACQKIIKKAVSVRLADFYCRETMPETGAEYRIRFLAHKNSFLMLMDTSGTGLHKRGYRVRDVAAPIKETQAAALVQLSFYRSDRVLIDPCCGSGTIPIEAAMIARDIAPGLSRSFASEEWDMIPPEIWKQERKLAFTRMRIGSEGFAMSENAQKNANDQGRGGAAADTGIYSGLLRAAKGGTAENAAERSSSNTPKEAATLKTAERTVPVRSSAPGPLRITAMDIDRRAAAAARANAEEAGVADDIDIVCMDMTKWQPGAGIPKGVSKEEHAVVISNLPYGKRVGDDSGIAAVYAHIRDIMEECPNWSFFLITSDKNIERELGRKADRRRKLYNGTIETQFYQFHGAKPGRSRE